VLTLFECEQAIPHSNNECPRFAFVRRKILENKAQHLQNSRAKKGEACKMSDLRHAIRILLKNRLFTTIAILTLAIGIGANTAIFSIVNGVLLRPLPYPNSDRVVALWEMEQGENGMERWRVTPANFLDWKRLNTQFQSMAAVGASTLNLTGVGQPEQLNGGRVTAGYFEVLGIRPMLGRLFHSSENEPGNDQVVILSEQLWKSRFASSTDIVGKSIELDGLPYEIVGVMPDKIFPVWPTVPSQFSFQRKHQEYWIPMKLASPWKTNRNSHVLGVIGRLKPQVTIQQAQTEMDSIAAELLRFPENEDQGIIITPFVEEMLGKVRPALVVLFGTVGFVLLIACANVSSLLLARMAARNREISIRSALGAGKLQLFRQFLMEGLLMTLSGGILGVWLAFSSTNVLLTLLPVEIPRSDQISLDHTVFSFAFLICLFTTLLFGVLMTWYSRRSNLADSLREKRATLGKKGHGFQKFLVVSQLGMAMLLVAGAALLIKSFWKLQQVDPGFNPDRLLVADMVLTPSKYSEWRQIKDFYSNLLQKLQDHPQIQDASIAYDHPLESNWINGFGIEGRAESEEEPIGRFVPVSSNYFKTAGIKIVKGRSFSELDDSQHPGVVIINEQLKQKYFRNGNAIGKRLTIGPPSGFWGDEMPRSFEIVGVVRDVKFLGLQVEAEPAFYIPSWQFPLPDMKLLIRTKTDPLFMVPVIRNLVWSMDPNQPIAMFNTMNDIVDASLAERRFSMILMGVFGGIALLLASVGVFGLFSYTVVLQTHEIGIRYALGASRKDIIGMVLKHALALILSGLLLGLIAAAGLTRFLANQLYTVSPNDPVSMMTVTLLLTAIALLACYIPARRAMRVDPIIALRYE
jgi:putative ABC transport system permease protein